jgi:hypothetical protein
VKQNIEDRLGWRAPMRVPLMHGLAKQMLGLIDMRSRDQFMRNPSIIGVAAI